jgi:hypothetical protein
LEKTRLDWFEGSSEIADVALDTAAVVVVVVVVVVDLFLDLFLRNLNLYSLSQKEISHLN